MFATAAATQSADRPAWLRVSGDQNTLVLVNGQRISENELQPAKIAAIPLASVERIEILRSGGAVLYGGGATGEPGDQHHHSQPDPGSHSGRLLFGAGSYDTYAVRRHWELPAKHWDSTSARGRYDTENYRDNNALRQDRGRQRPICGGARSDHAGFRHRLTGRPASRRHYRLHQIAANRRQTVFPQ